MASPEDEHVRHASPPSPEQIKAALQSMDDWDFEHFVADLWERRGWETGVEQQSADAGVDVRAIKTAPFEQKMLIQAKRYQAGNKVGGPDIQQYAALKQQEPDTDAVVVVTTSSFTNNARNRADELNVKLVDGDDLAEMVVSLEAYGILEEHLDRGSGGAAAASTAHEVPGNGAGAGSDDSGLELTLSMGTLIVGGAIGSQGVLWLLYLATGASAFGGLAVLGLLPQSVVIYIDALGMRKYGWDPSDLYVIGSLVPGLNVLTGGFYLLNRWVNKSSGSTS